MEDAFLILWGFVDMEIDLEFTNVPLLQRRSLEEPQMGLWSGFPVSVSMFATADMMSFSAISSVCCLVPWHAAHTRGFPFSIVFAFFSWTLVLSQGCYAGNVWIHFWLSQQGDFYCYLVCGGRIAAKYPTVQSRLLQDIRKNCSIYSGTIAVACWAGKMASVGKGAKSDDQSLILGTHMIERQNWLPHVKTHTHTHSHARVCTHEHTHWDTLV